jgi:uncharacterized protein
MAVARPFLTARWSNLALLTWAVPESLLEPHLPPGCVLDVRGGCAFVSLVAFDFEDTRVLGVRWPGCVSFSEVNLRFYVRHEGRRGVSFLRELVPRRLVAAVARLLYNEPYSALPMTSHVERGDGRVSVRHEVAQGARRHSIELHALDARCRPAVDSLEHFLKEHSWGYGRTRSGRLLSYEVRHPEWDVYPEPTFTPGLDFAALYGREFALLGERQPVSVTLAVGSAVQVFAGSQGLRPAW